MKNFSKIKNSLIHRVVEMKAEAKRAVKGMKEEAEIAMTEKAGQQAADNMGWIAVIVVVILVVLTFSVPAIRDGFLPDLQNKFKEIFTFHS